MKKTQRTETLATPHKYNHQNQDNKKYARNEKKKWKGNSWCKKDLRYISNTHHVWALFELYFK